VGAARYIADMNVKEALYEWVDRMSDEEAAELLARLEWEVTDEEELMPEEWEEVRNGLLEIARGETVPAEEVYRELGI